MTTSDAEHHHPHHDHHHHQPQVDREQIMAALTYRAPFLTEKLLKERIIERAEDGDAMLVEVIKYFILDRMFPGKQWEMISRRIDEVWHQFVLFTTEYVAFCRQYFARYIHHYPSNSPSIPPRTASATPEAAPRISPIEDFRQHYQELFGTPLPPVWFDANSMALNRRLLLDKELGELTLEDRPGGQIALRCEKRWIFATGAIARTPLEFIARTKAFYVRELPGELTDEEKLGLVEILVARHVLMVGT